MWGFDEAGSSVYSLWVGARLADDLLTSFSGSVDLTSLELWAEPPPRSKEGEFPIADRRSGWAKDYTWRQNWDELVEPEKLGGRTGVRLSSSVETGWPRWTGKIEWSNWSSTCRTSSGSSGRTSGRTRLIWLFPVELVVLDSVSGSDLRGFRGSRIAVELLRGPKELARSSLTGSTQEERTRRLSGREDCRTVVDASFYTRRTSPKGVGGEGRTNPRGF